MVPWCRDGFSNGPFRVYHGSQMRVLRVSQVLKDRTGVQILVESFQVCVHHKFQGVLRRTSAGGRNAQEVFLAPE